MRVMLLVDDQVISEASARVPPEPFTATFSLSLSLARQVPFLHRILIKLYCFGLDFNFKTIQKYRPPQCLVGLQVDLQVCLFIILLLAGGEHIRGYLFHQVHSRT